MCNFITATLPERADTAAFRAAVDAAALGFTPIENRHIQAQLRPKEGYFHATRGHCDCSTDLGRGSTRKRVDEEARKLRAKGWGEAKIAAWQRTRGPRPKSSEEVRRTGDLTHDDWIAFLRTALAIRHVEYVGLLQHSYRTSTQDEPFEIVRERRTLAQVAERLLPWRENVLYEIVAG